MRKRLEDAASIAKSAEACAEAGNIGMGVGIGLNVEQLCYEASRLLDSASLLTRLARENSREIKAIYGARSALKEQ